MTEQPRTGSLPAELLRETVAGRLRIVSALELRPSADRLTVLLNAHCDRATQTPPVFNLWNLPESFGHILRISDPTLLLGNWVGVSAFLGTEQEDALPPTLAFCRQIAEELGVAREQIVYLGGSGGGFAALQCAVRDTVAIGVAINPIIRIRAYAGYPFAEDIAHLFRPHATLAELCDLYPERFEVTKAVLQVIENGTRPRLAILQNTIDPAHFRPHYGSFCKALGVPSAGGADLTGHLHSITYEHPGGHAASPHVTLVEEVIARMAARKRGPP
jgi:hypothetical protein